MTSTNSYSPYLEEETADLPAELAARVLASGGIQYIVRGDAVVGDTCGTAYHPDDNVGHTVLWLCGGGENIEKQNKFLNQYMLGCQNQGCERPLIKKRGK